MALCAPRFPENVSGIASCSEMGSTHSRTLHSGQVPLALSCGELAVEPASCLEPTTSLALCTPRFPDVLSGIASCTDMGSRPSCTLHSGLPTFAPRCDEHAGGPGSYRRASNVLEANDTDPPSTVPSSGNAARIACRDADASLAPCTVPLSKGIAGIARCSRPEPSCFPALVDTRLLLSAEWIGHAPLDSALFNQSAELVPSAKVLSSASSGPHPFPELNVPPPGSLHLCMPFAQLQVCFLAFVATLCYRSVPTVHYYRVRRRLRAHVNVMNAAGDRLPRTSPLHAFRPGIRIAKGLRFASSYIFFQWHARRTRIRAERTARVARHALACRFPRSSQCTCDGTRLLASAADYVHTRSCIVLVALCYGSIALLLGGTGLFLLACHAFALRSAFDLPPGACALALALLVVALRPLRYCFCCSAGWFTTAMRFLALATGAPRADRRTTLPAVAGRPPARCPYLLQATNLPRPTCLTLRQARRGTSCDRAGPEPGCPAAPGASPPRPPFSRCDLARSAALRHSLPHRAFGPRSSSRPLFRVLLAFYTSC